MVYTQMVGTAPRKCEKSMWAVSFCLFNRVKKKRMNHALFTRMMKKRLLYVIVLCFSFFCQDLSGEIEISIIVPCYYGHFHFLEGLLDGYSSQTVLPDEVVISLSEFDKILTEEIEALKNQNWPFVVKIIQNERKLYAGTNRNIACQHAEGNIFICQDADDLPHPQRVEILKHMFDHCDVDHLLHRWIPDSQKALQNHWYQYDVNDLIYYSFNSWVELSQMDYVHYGNVAIRKSVFEKVKWTDLPKGQDTVFNIHCFTILEKHLF